MHAADTCDGEASEIRRAARPARGSPAGSNRRSGRTPSRWASKDTLAGLTPAGPSQVGPARATRPGSSTATQASSVNISRLRDNAGMKLSTLTLCCAFALPAFTAQAAEEFKTQAGVLKITPIQHATFYMEAGGRRGRRSRHGRSQFRSQSRPDPAHRYSRRSPQSRQYQESLQAGH